MVRWADAGGAWSRDTRARWCVREAAVEDGYEGGAEDAAVGAPAAPPDPVDPFDDADALEELGDEIATLAAHIHAATQRMLALIADFDRRRGWELGGHRSCAHWLAARIGIDLSTAREKVRAARVLAGLPATRAAMGRGELSFSQVRALTRVATPENETDLLELARGATTAQLERLVRGWKRGSGRDEATFEAWRYENRRVSVFPDEDGIYQVRGELTPELGALLMRALDAASDALVREHGVPKLDTDAERRKDAAQRRADALGLLAERALGAGFGDENAPVSGARAERYQVVLHVEPETLRADAHESGRSELDDGTRVSAETSRRLACDAGRVDMTHEPETGQILNVGRKTRTIPPALRRALEARDRGCRFPGCGLRYTDAHHIVHWADGGETSLGNCLLLCYFHHRLVHEGGWSMEWTGPGQALFRDPLGGIHYDGGWQPPELGPEPVAALVAANRRQGADPDGWTAATRWTRERDIPRRVLFKATEAALDALGP